LWTKPDGATVTYGYDNASNRTAVTTTFTFDERNRLTGASGGTLPDLTNTWTARGTLRSTTQDNATSTYTSDAFDQMLNAAEPGHTVEYRYDSLGRAATCNGVAFGYADQRNAPVNVPGDGTTARGARKVTAGVGASNVERRPPGAKSVGLCGLIPQ
jgi:hypothetical protein